MNSYYSLIKSRLLRSKSPSFSLFYSSIPKPKTPILHTTHQQNDQTVILQLFSWGRGSSGQLGCGNSDQIKLYPSPLSTLLLPPSFRLSSSISGRLASSGAGAAVPEVGISCGLFHSAVVVEGKCWIWGKGDGGRLGFGNEDCLYVPKLNPNLSNVKCIALGGLHSVSLNSLGQVFTWGYGGFGALGHTVYTRELVPRLVEGPWDRHICHISTSGTHTAAITESGELYTWGRDEGEGRLGLGPNRGPDQAGGLSIPSKVKALPVPMAAVSCGGFFTMALTEEGGLWNWGANSNYELGRGDKIGGWKPQPNASLKDARIIQIASGGYHSLALSDEGKVYSWGHGGHGQLGHSSIQNQKTPLVIDSIADQRVVYIACGGSTSAAVTDKYSMEIENESSRRELAKDPKRKAKSTDPGWKYAYWPTPDVNKDVKCILCGNQNHGGINRFKQHLIGGYPDIVKCPKTNKDIAKEINDFVQSKNAKKKSKQQHNVQEDSDDEVEEIPSKSTAASNTLQSSKSTAAMRFNFKIPATSSKSVASMCMRTPEQVVEDRHRKGASQTTLENRLRTPEEKERVHMHIANFFYECGIPFNAANSRSYEVMIESVGQYGPGLKPPTYHELRVPLLKKAKDETEKLKEKHEKAWKRYGCTLMSDGWTDRRGRHLINFLANSPEGTFFLGSVNASSESHDAQMLADLLQSRIKEIGEKNVVQVVTDNGANYKLAGQILEIRIPTLFWTPCAAHCLDLMLEDIGKIPSFRKAINQARRCTTFIYRHGRVLDALREKTNGRDLVRPGATRFATAFLTLQSLQSHREALRFLFCADYWNKSKLAKTENGKRIYDIVFSSVFWNTVDECVHASQPLLQVLRISDGDERPALAEVASAMDSAKDDVIKKFGVGRDKQKLAIKNKVVKIIEDRWSSQMGKPLYGAALFLNPGRYFDLLEKDLAYASRIREDFNDVLEKMVTDRTTRNTISNSVDDYKNTRGGFAREMAIEHRKGKTPLDWWDAYGGRAIELQSFAKRIVGLCCSSSGCERNWSTFEFIHTKRRNRLEHQRLNDLVYVQYNRKIDSRFKKIRELGKKFDPLVLEDLEWSNEWITDIEDRFWSAVDIASGASNALEGRNFPRGARGASTSDPIIYTRRNTSSTPHDPNDDENVEDEDNAPNDDEDVEDDYGVPSDENTQGGGEGEGDGEFNDFEMEDHA